MSLNKVNITLLYIGMQYKLFYQSRVIEDDKLRFTACCIDLTYFPIYT